MYVCSSDDEMNLILVLLLVLFPLMFKNAALTWQKTDAFFQPIKVLWMSHSETVQDNQSLLRCSAL